MAKKKVREAIDYGDYPERMGKATERYAADPNSLYNTNPAMRGTENLEKLLGNRFKKIVDHLKRVTGINDLSSRNVQEMLKSEAFGLLNKIGRIESRHKQALEQIALDASLDDTEVPRNWFEFKITLGTEGIDTSKFQFEPKTSDDNDNDNDNDESEDFNDENDGDNESMSQESFDVNDLTPEEELELEKHKRNIINAIVQGYAKKSHHLYEKPEVKAKLDRLSTELYPSYRKMMAIIDFIYFTMDEWISNMAKSGSGVIGQNYLEDTNTNKPQNNGVNFDSGDSEESNGESPDTRIVAIGAVFPILCHEIVKGIKEASARHGSSQTPKMASKTLAQTDIVGYEPMQMMIGPELVERLRNLLPDEMFEPENKGLIPWFEKILYEIPSKTFLNVIGDIISDDTRRNDAVRRRFVEIMNEAKINKSEYENYSEDENPNPDNGDELGGMLNDLGIDLPK